MIPGRLRDIPELAGLDARERRRRWSEAVSRSTGPRQMAALFAWRLAGAILLAAATAPWRHGSAWWPLLPALLGGMVAGMVGEVVSVQPRARRWLRTQMQAQGAAPAKPQGCR